MKATALERPARAAGSGLSPRGPGREVSILQSTWQVLIGTGPSKFSLCKVAAAAGMHLSNVQYYFPSRDALNTALMTHLKAGYERKYAERFASLPPDPSPRVMAMVDYLIEDIHSAETRRFFVQLWMLLDPADRPARLLNELYSRHVSTIRNQALVFLVAYSL